MALQKIKTLKNGLEGNYWRIKEAKLSANGEGYAMLALYKDKATRDNPNMTYIEASLQIPFKFTRAELRENNIIALIYGKIKESDFFTDAVDVLEE
jgi:hypothetical protein